MQKTSKKTLVMMIGISGSGKSTYLRKNFDPAEIVSPDDIRRELTGDVSNQAVSYKAWMIAGERIKALLKTRGRAVLDAVNVGAKDRGRFLRQFPGVEKVAVVFPSDPQLSKERIAADISAGVDRSNVPPDVIDRQASKLEQGRSQLAQQFDRVLTPESPIDEEVWRCVANSAGFVGGGSGGRTDLPPVPDRDGSRREKIAGAPEFFRESAGRQARYSAIVLDNPSRNALLEAYYHGNADVDGWEPIAHHMTLRMGSLSQPKKDEGHNFGSLLGRVVELKVKRVGVSDKALAVVVTCSDPDVEGAMDDLMRITKKQTPWHVTVAINRASGGKPVDSNFIESWEPVRDTIVLAGTVEEVL